MKRTPEEIKAEVGALRALVPVGPFARKTRRTIDLQIEALEQGMDDTADEWNELGDELQMAAMDALNWKSGDSSEHPSQGWGGLVQ